MSTCFPDKAEKMEGVFVPDLYRSIKPERNQEEASALLLFYRKQNRVRLRGLPAAVSVHASTKPQHQAPCCSLEPTAGFKLRGVLFG